MHEQAGQYLRREDKPVRAAIHELPPLHRNPFDRMIVAQAQTEGLTIVTADDAIAQYGIPVIDARR